MVVYIVFSVSPKQDANSIGYNSNNKVLYSNLYVDIVHKLLHYLMFEKRFNTKKNLIADL